MTTAHRELLAKQLLQSHIGDPEGDVRQASKPITGKPSHSVIGGGRPVRRHKMRLPSPTEEVLERREQGWNDRFTCNTPSLPKRPQQNPRSLHDSSAMHDPKERKICEKRQQYGRGDGSKHQRPGVGRLVPIGSLPRPPHEPGKVSSNEEKLRFNVLRSIDTREALIYQLNALVLCTPVQEALVMAAAKAPGGNLSHLKPRATMTLAPASQSSTSAMSNAREATRLAQQLAADLQIAGIHVVEGIVEWMLEAGANAERPPEFVWRGRNYFMKMGSDLDFAGPELHARGVELECFSASNPLCIRPDQRLGRVLAAQSIIHEMVDMAKQQDEEQPVTHESGNKKQNTSDRTAKTKSDGKTPRRKSAEHTPPPSSHRGSVSGTNSILVDSLKLPNGACSDELILAGDEVDEYGGDDSGFASASSAHNVHMLASSDRDSAAPLRDHETDKELVNILEESFTAAAVSFSTLQEKVSSASQSAKSTMREDYEHSFDAEDDEQTASREETGDPTRSTSTIFDSDATSPKMDDDMTPADGHQGSDDPVTELDNSSQAAPMDDVDDKQNVWDDVAEALMSKGFVRGEISGVALRQSTAWINEKWKSVECAIEALRWPDLGVALGGSVLHYIFSSTPERLEIPTHFIATNEASVCLRLPYFLWEECQVVIDTVCSTLARTLQQDLERMSPLISEVDFADIIEAAETLFQHDGTRSALQWVARAMGVMRHLDEPGPLEKVPIPQGFSRLIQVFYPYIINQRRDKLVHSWRQLSRVFDEAAEIQVEQLAILLNPTCKVVLLNVASLSHNTSQDDGNSEIPKLAIVCDRTRILDSSVASVLKKCSLRDAASTRLAKYQLFPFFQSSFGEKVVDGLRVEEGEGKGPLKEWFKLVAQDLTARWRAVELPADSTTSEFDLVVVNGDKLLVDRLEHVLQPGFKVEWRSPTDNTTISRIINRCDLERGTYMLDRGGLPSQSFNVCELRVYQPRTALFEYIQASESFWLNESVVDTPANRDVLTFCGWFLANALVHQCVVQKRIHSLLFDLILKDRCIAMGDLESLDPTLYAGIQQLQHMKPSEFAGYLEFEGLPGHMTVEEYTARTIAEKYGPQSCVDWQLRELRRGFHLVFTVEDLAKSCISARELALELSGDSFRSVGNDFVVEEAFRISIDPDFASCTPLRRCFWDAVKDFDPSLKRALVNFITGVDTLPQPGSEFLRIEMPFPATSSIECEKTLLMLPQSHTCDNTLELPHYWRALCWKHNHDVDQPSESLERELVELLKQKLRQAAEFSSGYGLDGAKAASSSLADILPRTHGPVATTDAEQLDVLDSYESLDLPGLGGDSVGDARENRPVSPSVAVDKLQPETTDMRHHDEVAQKLQRDIKPSVTDKAKDDEEYAAEDDWEEEELAD